MIDQSRCTGLVEDAIYSESPRICAQSSRSTGDLGQDQLLALFLPLNSLPVNELRLSLGPDPERGNRKVGGE